MSFLVNLYETLDELKYSPSNYELFLSQLNDIHGISEERDDNPIIVLQLTKKIITFFAKHLEHTRIDWYIEDSPLLYRTVKQLEAIAFLTGQVDEVLEVLNKYSLLKDINHSIEQYREQNFLLNEQELAFRNFDRNVLTIQFIIRILNAKFIRQRTEQVCGVVGFLQALVLFNPLLYAQTMSNLAVNGEYNLKQKEHHYNKLKLKITEETVLMKQSQNTTLQELADSDHIGLVGLRSAMNLIPSYSSKAGSWRKALFGVTTSKELKSWMKASGYHNCAKLSLKKNKHITQLNYLIEDGYTVGLCITSALTDMLLGDLPHQEPSKFGQLKLLLSGHFVLIKNVSYIPQTDKVVISFITWGREALNIEIDYKIFKANSGLSEAVIGLNDFAYSTLRAKNRETSDSLISPQAFCLMLAQTLPKDKPYKKLHGLINQVKSHHKGISWFTAAKNLQDEISSLAERMDLSPDILLLQNKSIIPDDFKRMLSKFKEIEHYDQGPRKIKQLKKLASEKNIEALCQLIRLYFSEHLLDELPHLFLDDSYRAWQNRHDNSRALTTLNNSCLEFISKISTMEELTRDAVHIRALHTAELLSNEVLFQLARRKIELSKNPITPLAQKTIEPNELKIENQTLTPKVIESDEPSDVKSNPLFSAYSMALLISSGVAGIALIGLKIAVEFGIGATVPILTMLTGPFGLAIIGSLILTAVISIAADYLYHPYNDMKPEKQPELGNEKTEMLKKNSVENSEPVQVQSRQAKQRPALKRQDIRFFAVEKQSATEAPVLDLPLNTINPQ